MVIKVPVTPVSQLTDDELFDFELSCDQELSRQFVNNLNHRRNAMNQVAQAKWMKDQDIVKYAVDFLLKNLKSFHIYEYPDSKTSKFRYKVTRSWVMKKMNKVDLLEKLNKLQNSMALQMTKPSSIQIDNFFILHQALLFAGEHEENFRDFAVLHSSHREEGQHQNGNGSAPGHEGHEAPGGSPRHCFVCGSVLLPRPYSYFSEAVADKVCQKCVRFAETFSHSASSKCQAQGGFCALMDTFEYQGGVLHYRGRDGVRRQNVSNCHVLCRVCRFRRCVMAGLRGDADTGQVLPSPQSVTSCVVCNSMKGISSLGVCSNCQEFLSDSVSEASHASMTCLHSGTCHVSSSNTATFSACPGCWIARLRTTGVLDTFLAEKGVNTDPYQLKGEEMEIKEELEEEAAQVCVVCKRETTSVYRDKLVCANCKKFVMKCVKSRCYMDFCCAGNSSCDLSVRSPCSFCWWAACLAAGLVETRPGKRKLE